MSLLKTAPVAGIECREKAYRTLLISSKIIQKVWKWRLRPPLLEGQLLPDVVLDGGGVSRQDLEAALALVDVPQ